MDKDIIIILDNKIEMESREPGKQCKVGGIRGTI